MSFGNAIPDPDWSTPEYQEKLKMGNVTYMTPIIDASDVEPSYVKAQRELANNPNHHVTHIQTVEIQGKAEDPHWCDPDYGKDKKAEAIARAVKSAIMRGEIDPSLFD